MYHDNFQEQLQPTAMLWLRHVPEHRKYSLPQDLSWVNSPLTEKSVTSFATGSMSFLSLTRKPRTVGQILIRSVSDSDDKFSAPQILHLAQILGI